MKRRILCCLVLLCTTPTYAMGAQTFLLGGIPGDEEQVGITIRYELSLPGQPHYPTLYANGAGLLRYFISGQLVRVRGEDIPHAHGTLSLAPTIENALAFRLRGRSKTIAEIGWATGRDITLKHLSLQARVAFVEASDPLLHVDVPHVALTTGAMRVAGKVVRGSIDIGEQRAMLIGTFRMPKTGVDDVDDRIAGEPVLIRLTVTPTPIDK